MYTKQKISVEDKCYEKEHISAVLEEIRANFDSYFMEFLDTEGGMGITAADFERLQRSLGVQVRSDRKGQKKDRSARYKRIIADSIDAFEKDRQKYIDLLDEGNLEEYGDDVASFKSKTLKNDCPIIHSTLFNKRAKELDKYRREFNLSDANELYRVVVNLSNFGREYKEEIYDKDTYEDISAYEELEMETMDTDECTVYGVIGGGIKSHMLFKVYPGLFPNRSRNAIWALWYLTDKKTFGCEMDSEFLMLDVRNSITQQNYFYPYELFSYYAFEIYRMLRDKAAGLDAYIDTDYRYVIADAFFNFIADKHDAEISFFKSQISDGGMGLA